MSHQTRQLAKRHFQIRQIMGIRAAVNPTHLLESDSHLSDLHPLMCQFTISLSPLCLNHLNLTPPKSQKSQSHNHRRSFGFQEFLELDLQGKIQGEGERDRDREGKRLQEEEECSTAMRASEMSSLFLPATRPANSDSKLRNLFSKAGLSSCPTSFNFC